MKTEIKIKSIEKRQGENYQTITIIFAEPILLTSGESIEIAYIIDEFEKPIEPKGYKITGDKK